MLIVLSQCGLLICKLDHVKSNIYVPCCRFVSWDCCSGYEKQNGERGCTKGERAVLDALAEVSHDNFKTPPVLSLLLAISYSFKTPAVLSL